MDETGVAGRAAVTNVEPNMAGFDPTDDVRELNRAASDAEEDHGRVALGELGNSPPGEVADTSTAGLGDAEQGLGVLAGAGDEIDHRVRRDRADQLRLPARHRDGGQAAAAERDRCGQVRDDLPRVTGRPRHQPPGQPG